MGRTSLYRCKVRLSWSLLDIFVLTPKFSTVIMFIAAKHDAQCGTEPRLSSSEDVSSWHPKKERSTVATA